jgi:hypothetical protein
MKDTKVFCVGFQKTGTTSMKQALGMLGYRVASIYGQDDPIDELRRSYAARGLARAREFDAVQDMPWPLIFRELDAGFPGARFVLTVRDTAGWLRSICGHFGKNPAVLQQLTYGDDAPFPVGHEARYAAVYEAHNAAVRAHFRRRPGDLLELDLGRGGAAWEPLCRFLGEPVPAADFPAANSARSRMSLVNRLRKNIRRMVVA